MDYALAAMNVCVSSEQLLTDVIAQPASNINATFSACFWLRKRVSAATGTIISQYLNGTEHLSLAITTSTSSLFGVERATFRYKAEDIGLSLTISTYYRTR